MASVKSGSLRELLTNTSGKMCIIDTIPG